jgi:hypothetical protein
MSKLSSVATSIVAVTLLAAVSATPAFAQAGTLHKTTYLTFTGTVQVPGTTLPAGTYLFRIGDPASQTYWQVWDKSGRHLLASFFYVPTGKRSYSEVSRGDGKPIVRFHETTQGVPPALRVLFYPSQLEGNEFLYPKEQAEQIAAASHQPVLALDDTAARGGVTRVVTVQPPTTDSVTK